MPPTDSTHASWRPSGEMAASIAVPVVVNRSIETRADEAEPFASSRQPPCAGRDDHQRRQAGSQKEPAIGPARDVDHGGVVHLSPDFAEIGSHLPHRSVPVRRILREALADDVLETLGQIGHVERERLGILLDDLFQGGEGVGTQKGALPADRFVEDASK